MTTDELKPCPMCGGSPNKPAKNGGSDERSGYNFTVTVACKCGLRIDRASHQGKQGWCDDSGQAEAEAIAAWNSRAQPAAPADAEPSVAPEPVAWEGGEGWESLAWELCADENGEDACNELIWEGGPIPEPWGDRWMKYEGEAKRLIALVHKHAAHPPRAPLTEEFWLMLDTALDALKYHQEQTRPIELTRVTIAAVETFISAHGIGGK